MTERITAAHLVTALRRRYPVPEWAFVSEVPLETGYRLNNRIDGWAINCYPSNGLQRVGFEIKVSRSDFLRELARPKWPTYLAVCDKFYFVVADTVKMTLDELPERAGFRPGLLRGSNLGLREVRESPPVPPEAVDELFATRLDHKRFLASVVRCALLTDPPFNPLLGKNGRAV